MHLLFVTSFEEKYTFTVSPHKTTVALALNVIQHENQSNALLLRTKKWNGTNGRRSFAMPVWIMHERITWQSIFVSRNVYFPGKLGKLCYRYFNTSVEPTIKKMSQINYIGKKVISNISQNII
jgi:hypothetical protein